MVKAVVGEVDTPISAEYLADDALSVVELVHLQGLLLREAQSWSSAVGERHQVTHVVIAPATDTHISVVEFGHITQAT